MTVEEKPKNFNFEPEFELPVSKTKVKLKEDVILGDVESYELIIAKGLKYDSFGNVNPESALGNVHKQKRELIRMCVSDPIVNDLFFKSLSAKDFVKLYDNCEGFYNTQTLKKN